MPRITISVISILIVLVLAFVVAVPGVFARDGADSGITALTTKETLTEAAWEHIQNLPAEAREGILLERGWRKIVIPENANSYEDLSDSDKALLTEEGLKLALRNYAEMEKAIPFSEFKSTERWVPPPEEQANYAVIGGWGGGRGDGNWCDFDPAIDGDVVLLKGGGAFPGIFCHAAIVVFDHSNIIFSMGSDGDRGVWFNSRDELHEYSHASVQRVDTWPWHPNFREEAKWYGIYQQGKPYNWVFPNKWDQNRFYCSQLCWASYYWTSPWYYAIDIDGISDWIDFGTVGPDAIWCSWRTSTVVCSD